MKRTLLSNLLIALSLFALSSCSVLQTSAVDELSYEYQNYTSSAYYLKVRGMVCGACVDGLTQELRKDKRIEDVEIDLEKEEVFIKASETSLEVKTFILKSLQVRGLELLSILQK